MPVSPGSYRARRCAGNEQTIKMTITKVNIKSPHLAVFYVLFLCLAIGMLGYYFKTDRVDILYVSGGLFLFVGLLIFIGTSTKIRIERKGITQRTLMKDCGLQWHEIKTIGVYRINKFGLKVMQPEEYDTFSLLGQKFIYVSNQPEYVPKQNEAASEAYVSFHWRKEAWDEIQKYKTKMQ